jgi:TonB-dependent receptor
LIGIISKEKKLDVMIYKWENILPASWTSFLAQFRYSSYAAFVYGFSILVLTFMMIPNQLNAQNAVENDTTEIELEAADYFAVSPSFSSTLNFSEYSAFGDISLREVLTRVSGVQVSRDGEISIRGVGYNTYGVSYNGLRLANTGLGTRNIDPVNISTDIIQSVEVIKVLDPSMSADALAGLVNLNSDKLIPSGNTRSLSVLIGGETNSKYNSRTGPGSRAWIQYAERFSDEISVSVNLGYHEAIDSWEELQLGYGAENFGNGFVDVFESVSPSVQINQNERFTASTDVYFTPEEEDRYYFRGYFNSNNNVYTSHRDSWITGGDWIDQTTTGDEGELGSFSHNARMQELTTSQFAFQAGGDHDLDSYKISYSAGWSQGRADNRDYLFPFEIEGLNYALDLSEKNRPQLEFTNREVQILDDGTVDRQFMIGQNFDRTVEEHVNNKISVRGDIEFPISAGAIKAGISSRWSDKEGEYNESSFEYNRTLRMISFNVLREPNRNVDVINEAYRIPWFVNTKNARAFLESQRPLFTADDNNTAYQSQIRNYNTEEQIYAAYGMADLQFGDLTVIAGARAEYSIINLVGNQVVFDGDGALETNIEQEQTESAFHLFPNLQLGYALNNQSSIKAAYSSTIDRPDYFYQTPFQRIDNQDSTTFTGNQLLEPVTADNIDLMVEQKTGNTGMVTIGGFYKILNNFIEQRQTTGSAGSTYPGYQQTIFVNSGETASVYGVEVSIDQRLVFLPGLFRNLGLYANYTWSQSSYRSEDNRDKKAITGQVPHVLNGALNYTLDRFKAQVSYHWSSAAVDNIAAVKQRAPALGSGTFFLDQYEDGYEELSATANYELSSRFSVWANVNHLFSSPKIQYLDNRNEYPTSTYTRSGFDLRVGVRFDL